MTACKRAGEKSFAHSILRLVIEMPILQQRVAKRSLPKEPLSVAIEQDGADYSNRLCIRHALGRSEFCKT